MDPSIGSIVEELNELQLLLAKTRDPEDQSIKPRRAWATETLQGIRALDTESKAMELLRDIQKALRGGMGSFLDIHLFKGNDSDLSEQEMNTRFDILVNRIYDETIAILNK